MPGYGFYRTKPHSFKSGIWAVQTALHIERNNTKRKVSEAARFERFSRLRTIHDLMIQDYCVPLNGQKGTEKDLIKLNLLLDTAWAYYHETALSSAQLSRYATNIKRFTLQAEMMCKKLNVGNIKDPIIYDMANKTFNVGEHKYYLGN